MIRQSRGRWHLIGLGQHYHDAGHTDDYSIGRRHHVRRQMWTTVAAFTTAIAVIIAVALFAGPTDAVLRPGPTCLETTLTPATYGAPAASAQPVCLART
jgi:hypothetical protein